MMDNTQMKYQLVRCSVFSTLSVLYTTAGFAQIHSNPNVLVIHTDEHNFRTLGCYRECLAREQAFPWGPEAKVETPNIDFLAKQGVLFTRCYATTPVSTPSRGSFLTGMYPQNANVLTNDMVLSDKTYTYAEVLRSQGYVTGYVGKLHLNGKGRPEWHPGRDFGFTDNRFMYNRGHWKKIENTDSGPQFKMKDAVETSDSLTFTTDYLTNRTIDFIKEHKDSSFCFMLSLPDPHSANQVRSPYNEMYREMHFSRPASAAKNTTGLPAWAYGNSRMEDMSQYFGMVKCIDDNIGRILNTLRESNLLDNTIIVFTSDHGDLCGEHGLINKSVPMDASARVPFIVYYPSKIKPGTRVDNVVSVADFTPSLLSFCAIPTSKCYDGRDVTSLWKGENLPAKYKDIVFMRGTSNVLKSDWEESESLPKSVWVAAVTPSYKIVYSENKSDKPCLFDLSKDPDELINCYFNPSYKAVVKELSQALADYGKKYNDPRVTQSKIAKEIEVITENFKHKH